MSCSIYICMYEESTMPNDYVTDIFNQIFHAKRPKRWIPSLNLPSQTATVRTDVTESTIYNDDCTESAKCG